MLIGIDRDRHALDAAAARLAPFGDRVRLFRARYDELPEHLLSRFGGLVDRITLTVPEDPANDAGAAAAIAAIRKRAAMV